MLRIIHNQRGSGSILIDDIDDGLPNKTAHRLGSSGHPYQYARDGYANVPKQPCYVPYYKYIAATQTYDTTLPGYVDLRETARVSLSATNGKIFKMQASNLVTIVAFDEIDLVPPVLDAVEVRSTVTILGVGFLSVAPNINKVVVTGLGATTLTQAQIEAAGGSFADTQVIFPRALVPGITEGSLVKMVANDTESNSVAPLIQPEITSAEFNAPGAGDITITGDYLLAIAPIDAVVDFDSGTVTCTRVDIEAAAGGSYTDTQIVVPAALVGATAPGSSVAVIADAVISDAGVVALRPTVASAQIDVPAQGDLTITGTDMAALGTLATVVTITGTGAVTLTEEEITTAGGAVAALSIMIPASLLVGVAAVTSSVEVTANGLTIAAPVAVS